MSQLLRLLALLAFMVGGIICVLDSTPQVVDLFLAAFVGLGLWLVSTLVTS